MQTARYVKIPDCNYFLGYGDTESEAFYYDVWASHNPDHLVLIHKEDSLIVRKSVLLENEGAPGLSIRLLLARDENRLKSSLVDLSKVEKLEFYVEGYQTHSDSYRYGYLDYEVKLVSALGSLTLKGTGGLPSLFCGVAQGIFKRRPSYVLIRKP